MSLSLLTQKSLSLFGAVGGRRTVIEGVVSRVLFLVTYLLTGRVPVAVLVAVGGVLVLAVVRLCTGGKVWQPAIGVIVVGVSALLAGSTGEPVDFYLTVVLLQAGSGVLFLASMLVRWPVIGLVMGTVCARSRRMRLPVLANPPQGATDLPVADGDDQSQRTCRVTVTSWVVMPVLFCSGSVHD